MATEYAGYISRTPGVDWLTGAKEITAGVEKTLAAQKQRKAENEALLQGSIKTVDSSPIPKTKNAADVAMDTTPKVKEFLLEANRQLKNREITREEYNRRVNNVNESWSSFASNIKSYDDRILAGMERQRAGEDGTPPVASSFEMFLNQEYAKGKNFKGKGTYIDPSSGRMSFGWVGQNGEPLDMSQMEDMKTLSNVENMVDNRVDVSTTVDGLVKNLGGWKTFEELRQGATRTVEDPRLNAEFARFKENSASLLVSKDNPRGVVGVLIDNSSLPYSFYKTESDKSKMLNDAFEIEERILGRSMNESEKSAFYQQQEDHMIEIRKDGNGVDQPVLTEKMLKDAREVVYTAIEAKVGHEEGGAAKRAPVHYGGGGSGSKKTYTGDTYEILKQAFDMSSTDLIASQDLLNSLAEGRYQFAWEPKGLSVYEVKTNSDGMVIRSNKPVLEGVKSGEQISPYIWGGTDAKGVNEAIDTYKAEKAAYYARGGGSQSTEDKKIPSASKSEWIKAGWSEAQIKQALANGSIKVL